MLEVRDKTEFWF